MCFASGRRRRHVCTSIISVSTTSSSDPTCQRRHEEPERELHHGGLVLQVVADRHQSRHEEHGEEHRTGELDQKLQVPARPRRNQSLELLHPDLPALLGHVRRRKERQADQEVARQLLRAGHRHVEEPAHRDLRQRRDHERGQKREANPAHRGADDAEQRHGAQPCVTSPRESARCSRSSRGNPCSPARARPCGRH